MAILSGKFHVPDDPNEDSLSTVFDALPAVDRGWLACDIQVLEASVDISKRLKRLAAEMENKLEELYWDGEVERLEGYIARRRRDGTK